VKKENDLLSGNAIKEKLTEVAKREAEVYRWDWQLFFWVCCRENNRNFGRKR
jgi:hypothetical protein